MNFSKRFFCRMLGARSLLRLVLPIALFMAMGNAAKAQTLTEWQCDPLSCEVDMGPVVNGGITLEVIGTCSDSYTVSRTIGLTVSNCASPVLGVIKGSKVSEETLNDYGCLTETDGVRGDA